MGGVLVNIGTLTLNRSTVSGNTGATDSGGILNGSQGTTTLTNSTVSGNVAGGDGGGIYNVNGVMEITNSTITANIAADGGGISHPFDTGDVAYINVIVGHNTPNNCAGSPTLSTSRHTLDSGFTCDFAGLGDLSGVDPLIGPLASNGGPTQTHALLEGSPALNAGSDADAPPADQRSLPRIGVSDIGAFESQTASVTFALVGGFNAIVFTGADGTPVVEIGDAIGPDLDTIFRFDADNQIWETYRPDAPLPLLNTLNTVNQADVLFVQLADGASTTLTLLDFLLAGPAAVDLAPGFTYVGFTGEDGTAMSDLLAGLPAGVDVVFRFNSGAQQYDTFRPRQLFLSTFTSTDRLDGLFIRNATDAVVALSWAQVGAGGS